MSQTEEKLSEGEAKVLQAIERDGGSVRRQWYDEVLAEHKMQHEDLKEFVSQNGFMAIVSSLGRTALARWEAENRK